MDDLDDGMAPQEKPDYSSENLSRDIKLFSDGKIDADEFAIGFITECVKSGQIFRGILMDSPVAIKKAIQVRSIRMANMSVGDNVRLVTDRRSRKEIEELDMKYIDAANQIVEILNDC